jgi:hypothetical protein
VPLAIDDLLTREALAVMVRMVAVVAEDNQIVVGICGSIPVNVVLSENPDTSNTANRAGIVCLDKQKVVKVHLVTLDLKGDFVH